VTAEADNTEINNEPGITVSFSQPHFKYFYKKR